MPAARVKGGPCPFRQSPFRRKALTVFDISRSHQLAWMSGFGGTRSPFARDIKQSNVPGSQDLGRSAPLRKTGAPCGIRTQAAARRGRARARSNRVALLGRYLHARIGRVGSLSRESTSPTRVAVMHANPQRSAIPMVLRVVGGSAAHYAPNLRHQQEPLERASIVSTPRKTERNRQSP
jgi:hypothetical protein